ncbi:MAG: DnaB-like helicase C-terminal domain-containing protein [Hydrogenophaga sp.]|nr:DnaB-like helicase C-terminal domain-containing protein [Hydrogenophaga sp.]
MKFDLFISHASEDKENVARPLADQLRARGLRVWLDETEIKLGDSLRRSIDYGLSKSKFGLVILSPDFLRKEWPQKELDGLVAREDGSAKVILPIWHNITRSEIVAYSPLLADKLAALTSKGLNYVVDQVIIAVKSIETSPSNSESALAPVKYQSYDFQNLVIQMLDRVQELADAGLRGVTGTPTGFYDLDRFTSGFQSESLVMVAGRPSSGKTAFVLSLADHVGCIERVPVVMFSPNESAALLTNRMICASGNIEPHHLRSGLLTEAEWPSLVEAIERSRHAAFHVYDANDISYGDIQSECRRLVELRGALGLVIVDSLQLVNQENNQNLDLGSLCRRLKGLAREIKCTILVTVDLDRRVHALADNRPALADLIELGEIDRYADLVLFLYRDEMHPPESIETEIAEVIVAKQKDGAPTGTVRLGFRKNTGKFENLSRSWIGPSENGEG